MSKLQTVEIQLPFAGFYDSIYSSEVDSQQESHIEYLTTEESDDSELNWHEALRIDAGDLSEIFFAATDYSAAYHAIARNYCAAFSQVIGEALGISAPEQVTFYNWESKRKEKRREVVESLRLEFAAMESPKFYNFSTDRIFARIPVSVVRKLWAINKADQFDTLTRLCRERHTSRDGFRSHYCSEWEEWGALGEWDHNQLMTLLIAACEVERADWEDSDLAIYHSTFDCTGDEWSNAVDWHKAESARHEKRVELLREWLESDPEAARQWLGNNAAKGDSLIKGAESDFAEFDLAGIAYRCPITPDLFAH